MELLCLTGVEDRLQDNVRPTLELLRNAGIKVSVRMVITVIRELWHFCLGDHDHGESKAVVFLPQVSALVLVVGITCFPSCLTRY